MAVNRVILGNEVIIDLTNDTASEEDVARGKYFHRRDGERVEGTLEPNAGGGGGGSSAPVRDVNFYDYDGTLLHSYTISEVQELTELPPLPEQNGLICQGWNWTLEDIKARNRETDVGATYITDDGKTRLYISIATDARMDVPLYFQQTKANGVTIDWGDGSATETLSGTGKVKTVHAYASVGDYVISLDVADGCTLTLGHETIDISVMGEYDHYWKLYLSMLNKVEFGSGVLNTGQYAFNDCYNLKSVTIPENIKYIRGFGYTALKFLVFPRTVSVIYGSPFYECFALKGVSLPNGTITFSGASDVFRSCYSLERLIIPNGITSLVSALCNSCYSLKKVILHEGITAVPSASFANCTMLTSIELPSGTTAITQSLFDKCDSLTSIDLPSGIKSIDRSAFSSCYSLTKLVIPSTVTSIGIYAFRYCGSMKVYDFTSHTTIPSLSSSSPFGGIPDDCEIRVPSALYDQWIAATNWAEWAEYIVAV